MQRRLSKLVVFLMLGAILNVLVAWSIGFGDGDPQEMMKDWEVSGRWIKEGKQTWQVRRRQKSGTFVLESERRDLRTGASRFLRELALEQGKIIREGEESSRLIPYWLSDFAVPTEEFRTASSTGEYRTAIAHGWPCLVTWSEGVLRNSGGSSPPRVILRRGSWEIPFIRPTNGIRPAVGYFLIWRGVIVNTIFYAAILWVLTLGPGTVRHVVRHKRGLCIECGYDLRGSSGGGCPECGWRREDVS